MNNSKIKINPPTGGQNDIRQLAEKFKISQRVKLGIFDFTDCEGCEVQILNLFQKILDINDKFDIRYWRLVKDNAPLDEKMNAALIEGMPMSEQEVKELKKIRSLAKYVVALGACAGTAGVPGMVKEKERKRLTKYVYGNDYRPLAKAGLPISRYVKVDGYLPGCPVLPETLLKFFSQLSIGRLTEESKHTVCRECKLAERKCFLLENRTCLGPIAQDGCRALCPRNNYPCYGCYGLTKDAQVDTLQKLVKNKDRNDIADVFLNKVINSHEIHT